MADLLRPQKWSDYIGQTKLKEDLEIRINAALKEERPLEPLLLGGPPGAGKTSLAHIIAHRMAEPVETLIMSPGMNIKVLTRMVSDFEGVLVLEEIHSASNAIQEALQPVTEFSYIQTADGHRTNLGFLSIIATTTRLMDVIKPLRDRFDQPDFEDYTSEEMGLIVASMARKAGVVGLDADIATLFGDAACGTPRKALKFVHGYKRLALHHDEQGLGAPTGDDVLEMMRIAHDGLTLSHQWYLEILDALDGARGLKPICSLMHMQARDVEEIELLLVEKKLLRFTDNGRELSQSGTRRARGLPEQQTRQQRAA